MTIRQTIPKHAPAKARSKVRGQCIHNKDGPARLHSSLLIFTMRSPSFQLGHGAPNPNARPGSSSRSQGRAASAAKPLGAKAPWLAIGPFGSLPAWPCAYALGGITPGLQQTHAYRKLDELVPNFCQLSQANHLNAKARSLRARTHTTFMPHMCLMFGGSRLPLAKPRLSLILIHQEKR